MAITNKAGNATLEVNGKIDSAGVSAVNTGNLNGNASTISLGGNAADFGTANLTVNEAVDFGIKNLNGNASTISFSNANSQAKITVLTGISATISGNISLENGIQLELMPHSTIRIAANGVTFSTGAETLTYTHSGSISISSSSRNNPLTYENTCREGNTLADYYYHNDDTDPSGVGMLVMGNSLNLVDSIEG